MQCPSCSTEVGANTSFCPHCGANLTGGAVAGGPMPPMQPPLQPGVQSGLSDNMAGALAYVTIIPAIFFLILEPYKRSSFIRFHSFQSIFLGVAWIVLHLVLAFIPVIGWILGLLVSLGFFVLWIILLFKASRGERFKVPVIGDLADQQARSFS